MSSIPINSNFRPPFDVYASADKEPTIPNVYVRIAICSMAIVVFACLVMIFFTRCDISNKVLLFAWTLGLGVLMPIVFYRTKKHPPINRYITLLASYIFIAFPFKAIISQVPAFSTIVPGYEIPYSLFKTSLVPAIAYTSGVGVAILVIMAFPYLSRPPNRSLGRGKFRYALFFWFVLGSLVVKAVAHYVLVWGVPNVPPRNVIPLVTGMTKMYVTLGIFHFLSVALTHITVNGAKASQKLLVGILTILYIGMDWGLGSKFSTIYTVVLLVSSAMISSRRFKINSRKLGLVAVAAIIAISAYPVIHNYRFAKREAPHAAIGDLVTRSIEITVSKQETYFLFSAFLKIVQRINGFQNHSSAVFYRQKLGFKYRDLISSADASTRYTIAVTGIKHESNTYGITQAGMAAGLYELDPFQIFAYSLALNIAFVFVIIHYTRRLCTRYANWLASGISIGLFIMFMQFHGGNFLFIGKQLLVLLFSVWFSNYFITRKPTGVKTS